MSQHPRETAPRRYDLDWLRVLAFGLLILYHIGMLYVERWGFHYKSAYLSPHLENLMLLVNPWRMALLWMVSGVASAYLLRKLSWGKFAASRTVRLLLPLAFGVWVIVPPQLFVEMSGNGDFSGSYLEFYRAFLTRGTTVFDGYDSGIWPHVDVNHLWYLRELWQFTLLLLVLYPLMSWLQAQSALGRLFVPGRSWTVLLVVPLLMMLLELFGFPQLGSEGDARRIALGLVFFLLGYLLVFQDRVWPALRSARGLALSLALITYVLYLIGYHQIWLGGEPVTPAVGLAMTALDHFNRWFWLCAVFGFANQYLGRSSDVLTYLSAGVYTFYLVHQTLILLAAFYLKPLALGPVIEPLVIIVLTFGGCMVIYEVVRRIRWVRPLFGLKWANHPGPVNEAGWKPVARAVAAAVLVTPIGLEILL